MPAVGCYLEKEEWKLLGAKDFERQKVGRWSKHF